MSIIVEFTYSDELNQDSLIVEFEENLSTDDVAKIQSKVQKTLQNQYEDNAEIDSDEIATGNWIPTILDNMGYKYKIGEVAKGFVKYQIFVE